MKRLVIFVLLFLSAAAERAVSAKEVTLFVTANLGGRFPLGDDIEQNELLRIAAYLRKEREKNPAAYHLDLGNAFFPGKLSRFSFGSLTADYLQMVRLDAGLVASGDLNIGADSLDYIRRARGIRLLSANVHRENSAFFEPYITFERGGTKLAVVGVTSNRSLLNYAEAKFLNLSVDPPDEALIKALAPLEQEKPELTVALTGVPIADAVAFLARYKQIDLVLCGGDTDGLLGNEQIRLIELPDGRRVIALPKQNPLMRIRLRWQNNRWYMLERELIEVAGLEKANVPPTFARRLKTWQRGFAQADATATSEAEFSPFLLTPQYAAGALRENFGCDVAFLESDDIDSAADGMVSNPGDVRYAVLNEYDIFTFRMTGTLLRQFYEKNPKLVYSGIAGKAVTGYPIRDNVSYRLCATQRGYEYAMRQSDRRVPANNQWLGISDSVLRVAREKIQDPDRVADSRFRLLTILNLSNVYETGTVVNPSRIDTPPGQARDSYFKWGLENDVNFMLYNRRHSLSLNPYVFYVRQNDQIIRNLLRGDLTYVYNTEWYVRPYQKNRLDTVVVPVNGQRPSFLRETLGAEFQWTVFTGRLGGGLEKEILDPVHDPNWGFEANIGVLWPAFRGIDYKLSFDLFSSRTYQNFWRHRMEISTSLIFTIAAPLTFTLSHRWYYFYLGSVGDFYNSSIFLISLDLRTTWKEP
jgi:hypothetical protein